MPASNPQSRDFIRVGRSRIEGTGLFAKRKLPRGHTIYQNARGEYFYLDPATGDMVFLEPETYARFREAAAKPSSAVPLKMFKWRGMKFAGQVSILGMDRAGNVIQQNARGETFYLDPNTGDMIFVR